VILETLHKRKFTVTDSEGVYMPTDTRSEESATLSPDEAFAVLGDETRLQILQTLGEADKPLAFSALFDRIEYDDSSNFGYHLDKLVDHFVRKADEGYHLQQAGRRVVESVLSGAVTDDPVLAPSEIDRPCPFCSSPIEVGFQQERVEMHCTECPGLRGHAESDENRFDEYGTLGYLLLPPAGIHGRTPPEVLRAAEIWTATEIQAVARGVCRRCSASVDHAVHACEAHDATDGRCDQCGQRFGARFAATCTNCIFDVEAPIAPHLAVHTDLMAFMIEHDIDPVSPEAFDFPYAAVEETILSTDPFEARFTFTADDDTLTLTVDGDLSVVDVARGQTAETE